MQVLIEVFPDDRVTIHTDSNLFKEGIDVRVKTGLAALLHDNQCIASTFNIVSDVLQLMASEWLAWASEQ